MLNVLPKRFQNKTIPKGVLIGAVALIALILIIASGGSSTPTREGDLSGFGGQSLAVLALLAFVGGIVSFVSPCTLPILPAYFAFATQSGRRTTLQLHTSQLFSGVLFVFMAILMLNGTLAEFNALIPADLAIWFSGLEDQVIDLFG